MSDGDNDHHFFDMEQQIINETMCEFDLPTDADVEMVEKEVEEDDALIKGGISGEEEEESYDEMQDADYEVPTTKTHEGYSVIDATRGLYADKEGNVFSRPAINEADQAALDRYWEEYMQQETRLDEDLIKDRPKMQTCHDEWEDEEEEFAKPLPVKGKRGAETKKSKCHYIGCRTEITTTPFTCPSIDGKGPDLPNDFCSLKCMVAFAHYEIGDPYADGMRFEIERRAGHEVEPAPIPVDMLAFQMGGLKTHEVVMQLTDREIENMSTKEERDATGKSHKRLDEGN